LGQIKLDLGKSRDTGFSQLLNMPNMPVMGKTFGKNQSGNIFKNEQENLPRNGSGLMNALRNSFSKGNKSQSPPDAKQ